MYVVVQIHMSNTFNTFIHKCRDKQVKCDQNQQIIID